MKINAHSTIWIATNRGYAGKTELPANLKAHFQSYAMMVPNFIFISEIFLFSGGFSTPTSLSVKLIDLFDLYIKQLSNTYHYNWRLKVMKTILVTAGKLKRVDFEASDIFLLVKLIQNCTVTNLVSVPISHFEYIIQDVFPGT
jgi:hypothetical protein